MRAYIKGEPCDHTECQVVRCARCDDLVLSCSVYKQHLRKKGTCLCMTCVKKDNRTHYEKTGRTRIWSDRGIKDFTEEDYDKLLAEQEGKCAICLTEICDTGYRLASDHDHNTGIVRGILCRACNQILGNAKDNIEILARAIAYLERNRGS